MRDADLLTIQRRRRQQGRCVRCGADAGRAVLCRACHALHWRYCPTCEALYIRPPDCLPSKAARSSVPCSACDSARRGRLSRKHHQPRADWLAATRAHEHPRLQEIIRHYAAGATLSQIAAALGMNINSLRSVIGHARRSGRWPRVLKRGRNYDEKPKRRRLSSRSAR